MSRAGNIKWLGVVSRHGEAVSSLKKSGDCLLVDRGYPRNLLFKCPDGCGEIITVNLDPASGPAWKYYCRDGLHTLYPSVVLTTGCKSHFILYRDKIMWCDYDRNPKKGLVDDGLLITVNGNLTKKPLHYAVLAEQLGELPWDIFWACRELVRMGHAQELQIGLFSKAEM
jgi:hypothetical protein